MFSYRRQIEFEAKLWIASSEEAGNDRRKQSSDQQPLLVILCQSIYWLCERIFCALFLNLLICFFFLQTERHFIMQVVCEATQSTDTRVSCSLFLSWKRNVMISGLLGFLMFYLFYLKSLKNQLTFITVRSIFKIELDTLCKGRSMSHFERSS